MSRKINDAVADVEAAAETGSNLEKAAEIKAVEKAEACGMKSRASRVS